jgi:hypothetical protein
MADVDDWRASAPSKPANSRRQASVWYLGSVRAAMSAGLVRRRRDVRRQPLGVRPLGVLERPAAGPARVPAAPRRLRRQVRRTQDDHLMFVDVCQIPVQHTCIPLTFLCLLPSSLFCWMCFFCTTHPQRWASPVSALHLHSFVCFHLQYSACDWFEHTRLDSVVEMKKTIVFLLTSFKCSLEKCEEATGCPYDKKANTLPICPSDVNSTSLSHFQPGLNGTYGDYLSQT